MEKYEREGIPDLDLDKRNRPVLRNNSTGDVLRDAVRERERALKQKADAEVQVVKSHAEVIAKMQGREAKKNAGTLNEAQKVSFAKQIELNELSAERRKQREKDFDLF